MSDRIVDQTFSPKEKQILVGETCKRLMDWEQEVTRSPEALLEGRVERMKLVLHLVETGCNLQRLCEQGHDPRIDYWLKSVVEVFETYGR